MKQPANETMMRNVNEWQNEREKDSKWYGNCSVMENFNKVNGSEKVMIWQTQYEATESEKTGKKQRLWCSMPTFSTLSRSLSFGCNWIIKINLKRNRSGWLNITCIDKCASFMANRLSARTRKRLEVWEWERKIEWVIVLSKYKCSSNATLEFVTRFC